MRKSLTLVAVTACALALGACSDTTPQPNTTSTPSPPLSTALEPGGTDTAHDLPDPCAMLTAATIESFSSVTMAEGEFNDSLSNQYQAVCDWWPADGSLDPYVQVLVNTSEPDPTKQREFADDFLGATRDISISGATDAYITEDGSIIGMGIGPYYVQVAFFVWGDTDPTQATTALAGIVASNT